MVFTEKNRKKNLIISFLTLFLFLGVVFAFSDVQSVHAKDCTLFDTDLLCGTVGNVVGAAGDAAAYPFKLLLLGIFTMLGWVASVAITLFEWVIKPENYSGTTGVLNQPVVYEMWKFIRDFFNLFFILVLLYTAFTLVFQINKDFKKALLSIVLAALFINFSYPVSRVLIDVTNVPMYFFANQMAASNGTSAGTATAVFSSALSASKIKGILIPGAEDGGSVTTSDNSFARYFIEIVFMFLFSITLLVLAVMFVVRLVALVILVIFSSVGFAASIVPGLSSYSKMWWENFWKYTFFGPVAMLMLLVATRFFSALGDEKTGIFKNLVDTSADKVSTDPTFFASMALFSIPIIMLWMTMGLAQSMSIAGAGSVVGQGKKFSSWAGKKTYNNPVMRGIGGGLKEKTGINKFQKWIKSPSKTEAYIKGGVAGIGSAQGWSGGARGELKDIHDQEVREKLEEHKKNNPSASSLEEDLRSTNKVKQKAAALRLAETKDITSPERLQLALSAVSDDMSQYAKVLQAADSGAMNLSVAQMTAAVSRKDANGNTTVNSDALKAVSSRMKKEGQANTIVNYQVSTGTVTRDVAVENMLIEIKSSKDKVKQESLFTDAQNAAAITRYVTSLIGQVRTELERTAAQESPAVHSVISTIP